MARIGIIGVGEIGRALAEGICTLTDPAPEVLLSPRGAAASAALAERFANARVCADNQEVADGAEVVVVAVRGQDHREALAGLRIAPDRTVVNVMSGVSNDDLRRALGTEAALVRAIPLPSVREHRCVTVTYPANPVAEALFDRLGGAQPVADEATFDVCSTLSGTITTHYAFLAAIAAWAVDQGLPAAAADRVVRNLFQDVGRSLGDESRTLDRLAADHETPGGNNERIRTTWFDKANAEALRGALNGLLTDLRNP
ncbi:NAD(P)-binding domain-containing protein [Glycomyces paridis]|uniref:Pyrroline-5-carboxylate reductase n=1 Tax=Glycomyces paridis TaxID=2126555 RepID=A0A4S8P6R1_9ACTN|nr:NAD(P)-binding domain-containing protein [Glycomyces paridis]THV25958.1 pyrroline-5-carboxylate reductase [Glycomyces paridis]